MKTLLSTLKTSTLLTLVLAVILCAAYPLAVWAGAQLLFPRQASGSLITSSDNTTILGSSLIGQPFASPRYFHPRPSAAGDGYDASNSSGSNLGPTSQKLADLIRARAAAYRAENNLASAAPIPADAITASASGLDPHISPANAQLQAPRVAAARGIPPGQVRALIAANTTPRDLGILGEETVNVLLLNLALDKTK